MSNVLVLCCVTFVTSAAAAAGGGIRFVGDTRCVAFGQRYAFKAYSVIGHLKRTDSPVIYWQERVFKFLQIYGDIHINSFIREYHEWWGNKVVRFFSTSLQVVMSVGDFFAELQEAKQNQV